LILAGLVALDPASADAIGVNIRGCT